MWDKFALIIGTLILLLVLFTKGVWNFLAAGFYEEPVEKFTRKDRLAQILFALLILGCAVLAWIWLGDSAT